MALPALPVIWPKKKHKPVLKPCNNGAYEVMVGKTLGSNSDNYFSGTDEERLNELQAMLDDDSINAILMWTWWLWC